MSFRPFPTLEDVNEIVRPINTALMKDLRVSAFLEDVRKITDSLARNRVTRVSAVVALRQAIKDVERG